MDGHERHFIEQVGLFYEGAGLPRMAGRILGVLLVCDPLQQGAKQLAEVLDASKASISTNTRLLVQVGLVDRVALRGERGAHYMIREGCWSSVLEFKLRATTAFLGIAEEGLDVLADASPERRARLEEVHDLYTFFEEELPALMARWRARKESR